MKYLLPLFLILSSCLGPKAKDDVLFPPIALAWPAVQDDVERGIQDGVDDGVLLPADVSALNLEVAALDDAIDAHEADETRTGWPGLRPWAERGVTDRREDGEIGPAGAAAGVERINQFSAAVAALPPEL